jgi:4-amino-4-deoxy-L-arabinose transferase-like glycosyltransferase
VCSGLCFGLALLTKETAIVFAPALLLLAVQERWRHQGRFAIIGWLVPMMALASWYPGSDLEMGAANRAEKRTKFGSVKHVYDRETMRELRSWFETTIGETLPGARILYWT